MRYTFVDCCASTAYGATRRLRVRATMHPAVQYHMVVSFSRSADFLPFREAERCASAAPGSRSVAEAGGRRLQAVVRLGCSIAFSLRPAKQTSQAGPVQSNGMCLLDLPAQFHWNPWASTWLAVALPQVATCPGPTSDPGGFRSWTRAPGGVVGPDSASAAATTLPGISARQ